MGRMKIIIRPLEFKEMQQILISKKPKDRKDIYHCVSMDIDHMDYNCIFYYELFCAYPNPDIDW